MRFEELIDHILDFEGGYVNHPNDPGGETNFGISKKAYPNLDIKNLKKREAEEIYKKDYWDKMRCDEMPKGIRFILFDCAINQGIDRATRLLQRSLGMPEGQVDGIIGPKTLKASKEMDEQSLMLNLALMRYDNYTKNPRWEVFGKGWAKRLLKVSILSFIYLNRYSTLKQKTLP